MFNLKKTLIEPSLLKQFGFERIFILLLTLSYSFLNFADVYVLESNLITLLAKLQIEKSVHMTMASISAIILAFFIPYSLDIVTKISERYQSEVVTSPYSSRWEQFWFPTILIIHILLSSSLLFTENINEYDFWNMLSWISFTIFLYIVPKVGHLHRRTKKYVSSTDHILDNLFKKAEEIVE